MYEIIWQLLTMFGDIQYWVGLTVGAFIIYLLLPHRDKSRITWIILAMLPAILLSYQFAYVLKLIAQVPRPCFGTAYCPSTYSFPSGHAAVIFAFATVLAMKIKKKIVWAIFIFAALVALSRVMLNVHTYFDIMAGAAVGVFCGYLFFTAYKTLPMILGVEIKTNKKRKK
jgi:undecaprenyl-diphosphatase